MYCSSAAKGLASNSQVYDNRIYRYLDKSMDLTNVKDEDYLVAYRLPNRGVGKTKLEVMHRWIER